MNTLPLEILAQILATSSLSLEINPLLVYLHVNKVWRRCLHLYLKKITGRACLSTSFLQPFQSLIQVEKTCCLRYTPGSHLPLSLVEATFCDITPRIISGRDNFKYSFYYREHLITLTPTSLYLCVDKGEGKAEIFDDSFYLKFPKIQHWRGPLGYEIPPLNPSSVTYYYNKSLLGQVEDFDYIRHCLCDTIGEATYTDLFRGLATEISRNPNIIRITFEREDKCKDIIPDLIHFFQREKYVFPYIGDFQPRVTGCKEVFPNLDSF